VRGPKVWGSKRFETSKYSEEKQKLRGGGRGEKMVSLSRVSQREGPVKRRPHRGREVEREKKKMGAQKSVAQPPTF